MIYYIVIFIIASLCTFLQSNLQFINEWWKDKHALAVIIFSIPTSYLFIKCHQHVMNITHSVMTTKFIFFSMSNLLLTLFAYIFFNENCFNIKNLVCLFLSSIILIIQIKF